MGATTRGDGRSSQPWNSHQDSGEGLAGKQDTISEITSTSPCAVKEIPPFNFGCLIPQHVWVRELSAHGLFHLKPCRRGSPCLALFDHFFFGIGSSFFFPSLCLLLSFLFSRGSFLALFPLPSFHLCFLLSISFSGQCLDVDYLCYVCVVTTTGFFGDHFVFAHRTPSRTKFVFR